MQFLPNRLQPLNREARIKIRARAETLNRKTESGKHYGILTGKHLDVLEQLLWLVAGDNTPTLETIADKAGCGRSTVHEAVKALEAAGILTTERVSRTSVKITWEG